MKIHMDYLENKLENVQSKDFEVSDQIENLQRQLDVAHDKMQMIKEARANEQRDAQKRIEELREQNRQLQKRLFDFENLNNVPGAEQQQRFNNQRQLSQVSAHDCLIP